MTRLEAMVETLVADVLHDFIQANDGKNSLMAGVEAARAVATRRIREWSQHLAGQGEFDRRSDLDAYLDGAASALRGQEGGFGAKSDSFPGRPPGKP